MSSLLLKSRPIVVIPELAMRIGLNEAMLLQQLHYWLTETNSGIDHDGRRWVYNTTEEWVAQFPFWSESTIKRGFASLKSLGCINIERLAQGKRDQTNYYSINYDHVSLNDDVVGDSPIRSNCTDGKVQNEPVQKIKMTRCKKSKRTNVIRSNCTDDLTESTTENTNKDNNSCRVEPDDANSVVTDQAKQVLTHLNQVTGSRYQVSKTSIENIRARLTDGYTVEELKLVIDYSNAKWANDLKMVEYLRPTTLFNPSKFDGYLRSARKWHEAGSPVCIEGKWVKPGTTVDAELRDKAFRRFTSGVGEIDNPCELEKAVRREASKSGIKSMRADFAATKWNSLWTEVSQRVGVAA